jgi:hypothetical protein
MKRRQEQFNELGDYDASPDIPDILIEIYDDLEQERDSAREANQWQPIETAPKGRGSILVYRMDRLCTFCATWDDITNEWRHFGGSNHPIGGDITHWTPLPKPPTHES